MRSALHHAAEKIILLNTLFISALVVLSCYLTGVLHALLRTSTGAFPSLAFAIHLLSFMLFYLFLLAGLGIYACALRKMAGNDAGTWDAHKDPKGWRRQLRRVITDSVLADLAYPFIHLFPFAITLFGAKAGRNITISGKIWNPELLEIGDNVIIGVQSIILPHILESKVLIFARVKIGNNCVLGTKALLMPGVEIGDNSMVAAGAVVIKDTRIPPNEIWGGIPARKIGDVAVDDSLRKAEVK